MRPPTKSKFKSDSNQLVLVKSISPVPLQVYDPRSPLAVSLRKSPRFAPISKETKSRNVAPKFDPNSLRKSPRFSPSPELVSKSRATKVKALVDPNSLRKSPRFTPSPKLVKLRPTATKVPALVYPNSLRRSPGVSPSGLIPISLRKSPRPALSREEVNRRVSIPKASKKPASVDSNSNRRSSRLSPSQDAVKRSHLRTPKLSKTLALIDSNSLRKSPRLREAKQSSSAPVGSKNKASVNPNHLSKSTLVVSTPTGGNVGKGDATVTLRGRSARVTGDRVCGVGPILRVHSLGRKKDSASRESEMAVEKMRKTSPRSIPPDNGGEKSSSTKSRRSNVQDVESIVDQEEKCTWRSHGATLIQNETTRNCSKVSAAKTSLKRNISELDSSKPSCPRVTRSKEQHGESKSMPKKCEPVLSGGISLESSMRILSTAVENISEVIKKVLTDVSTEIEISPCMLSSTEKEESIKQNTFDELSDSLDECPSKSGTSSDHSEELSMGDQEESNLNNLSEWCEEQPRKKIKSTNFAKNTKTKNSASCSFVGDPIPDDEARERWRWRYEMKDLQIQRSKGQAVKQNDSDEDEVILDVECHYAQACVGNCIFSLGDCAYIQGDGNKKHVGRIIEFFKTTNGEKYFRVQWFYFVEDTVIQKEGAFHDKRRLFYSTILNDNLIECIISKVLVTKVTPRVGPKISSIAPAEFYFDMEYCVDYSTFRSIGSGNSTNSHSLGSTFGFSAVGGTAIETNHTELTLLDLYSGCGGMSTGLTLGAKVSGVNLVTRWAVDYAEYACESLKLNHPETNVRNEGAEDFLELLKQWEKLCKKYRSSNIEKSPSAKSKVSPEDKRDDEESSEEFEVSKLVGICYGDPSNTGERGLKFKVRWKGYDSSEDTWEPVEGLSNCPEKIEEFVREGMKTKILPLPTDVDVICGGPPCQGISGYNRFRNVEAPLDDERNRQIIIFMDIVNFLKPKYVLMENVLDMLKFDKGSLGRYALSRLVDMKYQARMGIIAAGCYGLPQFRLRVFFWGALPHENLPQFPLPTHDVIIRYWPPPEFERNTVAYDESQPRELEKALVLQDAISDLPQVTNDETREEIPYEKSSETEFQRYVRSTKSEMGSCAINFMDEETMASLYDHRPFQLFEDDYTRVCKIPKRKGANFRDLPGVVVGRDNVARRDPDKEIIMLPSGKPLVPDYAFTFEQGKSKRPFARLWWDETVPTVLTSPSCHNQVALHPEIDRILTLREYARLQGFPDYYRFCGTLKQRYLQVGNAVPVNVSRALGHALGMAIQKRSSCEEHLLTLPRKFSLSNYSQLASQDNAE